MTTEKKRMNRYDTVPGEAPGFEVSDLLVSRTDERGVIASANEVFARISGYAWSDLNNAPHKIVRHPEMPRGLFHLFWDQLKLKNTVGAFVKNRTANGRHYWVFAFAAPQGDGYFSVRMKPTNEVVEAISSLYEDALQYEADPTVTPEQSAAFLLTKINGLGFRSYQHFMAHYATELFRARNAELGRAIPKRIDGITNIAEDWSNIRNHCESIRIAHKRISHTPTNLRVQAARLNDQGIALSVIASNFTVLASEIEVIMTQFLEQAAKSDDHLNQCVYSVCFNALMEEVAASFQHEKVDFEGVDWATENRLMVHEQHASIDGTARSLSMTLRETEVFANTLEEIERVLSGLSVAKVMCEIEAAQIAPDASSGVAEIIRELDRFRNEVRKAQLEIQRNLSNALRTGKDIQRDLTHSELMEAV